MLTNSFPSPSMKQGGLGSRGMSEKGVVVVVVVAVVVVLVDSWQQQRFSSAQSPTIMGLKANTNILRFSRTTERIAIQIHH